MIIGVGVDMVVISRIAATFDAYGERFLTRIYAETELDHLPSHPSRRDEYLAVRFAGKEAVMKALGTGWRKGVRWRDIKFGREPGGRPIIELAGAAATIAQTLGIDTWHVSMTHDGGLAMATVIAERTGLGAQE